MSTSYSKAQLHKAFYAAAEHIERNPKLYNFYSLRVPSPPDCGCAWGWVGAKLGLPERITDNIDAAIACGFPDDSVLPPTDVLYRVMRERGVPYSDAAGAASALRAFADLHYAEQLDPSYIKARTALQRFIEGDDSARVEFDEAVGVMYDAAVQRGMEESGYAR